MGWVSSVVLAKAVLGGGLTGLLGVWLTHRAPQVAKARGWGVGKGTTHLRDSNSDLLKHWLQARGLSEDGAAEAVAEWKTLWDVNNVLTLGAGRVHEAKWREHHANPDAVIRIMRQRQPPPRVESARKLAEAVNLILFGMLAPVLALLLPLIVEPSGSSGVSPFSSPRTVHFLLGFFAATTGGLLLRANHRSEAVRDLWEVRSNVADRLQVLGQGLLSEQWISDGARFDDLPGAQEAREAYEAYLAQLWREMRTSS